MPEVTAVGWMNGGTDRQTDLGTLQVLLVAVVPGLALG